MSKEHHFEGVVVVVFVWVLLLQFVLISIDPLAGEFCQLAVLVVEFCVLFVVLIACSVLENIRPRRLHPNQELDALSLSRIIVKETFQIRLLAAQIVQSPTPKS